jgi:glycosyltransferase involved in cell wall biosynthesis
MDLARTLPRIDRDRFQITVCTFLLRGELGKILQDQGIDVIGPLSHSVYRLRQHLSRLAQRLLSKMKGVPLCAQLYRLIELARGIAAHLLSWVKHTSQAIKLHLPQSALSALRLLLYLQRSAVSLLRRSFWAVITCVRLLSYSLPTSIAYLLEIVRLAFPIAQHIRAARMDLVHTVLPNSYLIGACASVLSGRPPILMSRLSLNVYQRKYKLIGFIERYLLHRVVDAAIGNSNAILSELKVEGINASKLYLVHNGIDVHSFEHEMLERLHARRLMEIPDGALVFSVISNLHPYKGHRDLISALAILSKRIKSDWLCLLVGRDVDNNLPELKRRCLALGIAQNVRFLGPRRDVPAVLSASDIHVSASLEEGLPNNIIEAMCASLPVVATAVGGVPELVVDGETGYLVEPRDADWRAVANVVGNWNGAVSGDMRLSSQAARSMG